MRGPPDSGHGVAVSVAAVQMTEVSIGPTEKEVTVNTMFTKMVPRLHAPERGRITRFRHPDGLADSLRDASTWLWRIANSLDAYHGKPFSRRSARRTTATGVALCGGMLAGMGMMYLLDQDAGRRQHALVRDKM